MRLIRFSIIKLSNDVDSVIASVREGKKENEEEDIMKITKLGENSGLV